MNRAKVQRKREASTRDDTNSNSDDPQCCVCYRTVDIYSIGECNHPVCYNCSTRMRVLCISTECAICRKDMASVVFTKTPHRYMDLNFKNMAYDRKASIYFEDDSIMKSYDKLLEHVCTECSTLNKFSKFCHLERHMIENHGKYYCHLCVDNLKCFTHERKYYEMSVLRDHRSNGDIDDKSHRGHPLCQYCNERYMDKDALFFHMRRNHYHCHFCDADGLQHFYDDYQHLRSHFERNHFLCKEGDCEYERFTSVFRSKFDMKAHWSQRHAHTVSKQEARQARTVDTEFTVFWRANNDRGRGRGTGSNRMISGTRTEQDLEDQESAAAALPPSISPQKPVNIRSAQDFPSLGRAATAPTVPDETKNNNQNKSMSKSMSQRFAEQNRFSVRTGNRNLNQEDFPLLNPLMSLSANLPSASVQVSVNRKNQEQSTPPVPLPYKTLGQANENKKPKIKSISHSDNITLSNCGARPKVTREEYPSLGEPSQQRAEKPTWVKPQKSVVNGNPPRKEVREAKVKPVRPDFDALNDFPSLGGASGNLKQILSYAGRSSVNVPMKKVSTPQVSIPPEDKHKKKTPVPLKASSVRSKKKINLSNIFNDAEEEDVDLSMTRLGDYQSVASKRAPNVGLVKQVDFVRSELKIGELANPKFKKGDFPSLGGGSTSYQDVNSNWRVPVDKSRKSKSSDVEEEVHESQTSLYSFLLPSNFDDRNKSLIRTISLLCQNDATKFNKFKTVAAQLRSNELDYKSYYQQCKQIMGKNNFLVVFPELIALLPDIKAQQGILREYQRMDCGKGLQIQFAICSTCQQVLLPEDFSAHAQTHILML